MIAKIWIYEHIYTEKLTNKYFDVRGYKQKKTNICKIVFKCIILCKITSKWVHTGNVGILETINSIHIKIKLRICKAKLSIVIALPSYRSTQYAHVTVVAMAKETWKLTRQNFRARDQEGVKSELSS